MLIPRYWSKSPETPPVDTEAWYTMDRETNLIGSSSGTVTNCSIRLSLVQCCVWRFWTLARRGAFHDLCTVCAHIHQYKTSGWLTSFTSSTRTVSASEPDPKAGTGTWVFLQGPSRLEPDSRMSCGKIQEEHIDLSLLFQNLTHLGLFPVVPYKAVAEVSKVGNL